jgi:hypothetical protein
MGSRPWKAELIARLEREFAGEGAPRLRVRSPERPIYRHEGRSYVLVPVPEREVTGQYVGEVRAGALTCICVNIASTVELAAWKALSREQRVESDFFERFERWIPVSRGIEVEAVPE